VRQRLRLQLRDPGRIVAWFVGWNLVLEYMMACSTVAVGWSRYFVKRSGLFHMQFAGIADQRAVCRQSKPAMSGAHRRDLQSAGGADRRCGHGPVLQGHQGIGHVNTIIVAIKVSIVVAVIMFGAFYVNTANWFPYIPPNTGTFGQFGWSRSSGGRGDHLLRLYRLRRRLDRGAGGQGSGARHADRHARQPGHLHGALHPDVERDDRAGAVQATRTMPRRWSSALKPHPQLNWLQTLGHHRCAGGPDLGDHHDDHSAGAHLADDVARRPAAEGLRQAVHPRFAPRTSRR
jgi:hypothetical protein